MFGLLGIAIGILLGLLGVFLVFFFPGVTEHQPESMSWTGIVIGIFCLIAGAVLIFL
ncbi:MAG: hypothetical protein HY369_00675 [Candidatus Aenigmarchaeota archaeon]|nr:hypothetical protein [Candidatus Aenigmarchaeota archaeon]